MSYWFQLGTDGTFGQYSYDRNLNVESLTSQVHAPAKRYKKTSVLGLDGYLLTGGGELESVKRTAVCFGASHTASTANYILGWLRNNNNVIFSDDPTHYRKYNLFEEMTAETTQNGKGYEIEIPFECDPFRYWTSPTEIEILSAGGQSGTAVQNTATAANAPLIRVGRINGSGGSGWVQFGAGADNRVEFSDLKYPLYIDTALREVYYEDTTNGNANSITTLQKFPTWAAGQSKTITFGGNVLKLLIKMRERDLN